VFRLEAAPTLGSGDPNSALVDFLIMLAVTPNSPANLSGFEIVNGITTFAWLMSGFSGLRIRPTSTTTKFCLLRYHQATEQSPDTLWIFRI